MTHFKTLFSTTAVVALVSATPSFADVTAQEVWTNFQEFGARYGQRITGTESQSGGVLTVTDISMGMSVPEAEIAATIPQMTFAEQGDGTVKITMSPEMIYSFDLSPAEGEDVSMKMRLTQEGLAMIAGGDASSTRYDFTAGQLAIEFTDFDVEGEEAELTGRMAMTGLKGSYQIDDGTLAEGTSETAADTVTYTFNVSDPSEATTVALTGQLKDLASQASFALPQQMDMTNLTEMLKAGLRAKGGYTYGAYEFDMNIEDGNAPGTISTKAGSGELAFELSDRAIDYGGSVTDMAVTLSGMQIPLPQVNLNFEKLGGRFMIPVAATDSADDFALRLELGGLTISEQIWGMFDPTAALPRDPATLILDTTGKLRWLFDIFDPEAAALVDATGGQPAEVEALDIKELVLSVVGAELTGSGGFTFDNSDTETFDGMPAPTGSVALNLKGANGLMDNLVKLGFVPEDQIMGVRMMLGLFARPGAGPDELVSEIQITEDGQILANGQRLK